MKRIDNILRHLAPFFTLPDGSERGGYTLTGDDKRITMKHRAGGFEDALYLEILQDEILCRRVFTNTSDSERELCELGVTLDGITFGEDEREDYFYHNENARIYECMTFPIDLDRTKIGIEDSGFDVQAGTKWADPGVVGGRIGSSPYMPFPAILISNYNSKNGVVHGTLSQDVFYHSYEVCHDEMGIRLDIFSSFKCTESRVVKAGESLCDEWYIGYTDSADDIEKIFEGYTTQLRKRLTPDASVANRGELVWGSWNDGVFRDVNEDLLVREAEYLKENFPTVKWIQLDDGYSRVSTEHDVNDGIAMPFEADGGLEKSKFPNGLRHMTDRIRGLGLRPALWIGLLCYAQTEIYKRHPEWFADYGYRIKSAHPLDVSQPEVREYMENAVKSLVTDNGFEGVKLDFWSYAFEDKHPLYKNNAASGGELRTWWLKTLRNALPRDGYLEVACDLCQGNPFMGQYINNHRYGIDIADGRWEHIKTNYLWGAANLACHTGDLIIPNSDSIGIFPDLNDSEMLFLVNYCIATHTLVEISGLLSKCGDQKRLAILKKAACNPNNGQPVHFAQYDYRSRKYAVPEIMYFTTPHFSTLENNAVLPLRTVGIFNINDEEKTYSFTTTDIGLESGSYTVVDVWTGEMCELDGFEVTLPPHASALLAISRRDSVLIHDADLRITSAEALPNGVAFVSDYGVKSAHITLARSAKSVTLDGQPLDFAAQGNTITLDIPHSGRLEITFDARVKGFCKATTRQIMSESCCACR